MREIKFRMLVQQQIDEGDNKGWSDPFFVYYTTLEVPTFPAKEDIKIIIKDLQFTGLYDKNGKEIYEGDVVDGYSGKYQLIFVQVTGTGYFFYWKPLEQCTESMTGFIDEYTVIGNIYENKDLPTN